MLRLGKISAVALVVPAVTAALLFPVTLAENAPTTVPATVPETVPEIEHYASWTFVRGPFTVTPELWGMCVHHPFVGHQGTELSRYIGGEASIRVYANEAAATMLLAEGAEPSPAGPFPTGSVIVKEKLATFRETASRSLGVMIKREPGFDSENADWEFLFQASDGRLARGASDMPGCYGCHRAQSFAGTKTLDYVFVDHYRRPKTLTGAGGGL